MRVVPAKKNPSLQIQPLRLRIAACPAAKNPWGDSKTPEFSKIWRERGWTPTLTPPARTLFRRFSRRRPLPVPSSSSSEGLGSLRAGESPGVGFCAWRRRLRRWRSRREGRPFFLRRRCGDGVSAGAGAGGGGGGFRVFAIGGRNGDGGGGGGAARLGGRRRWWCDGLGGNGSGCVWLCVRLFFFSWGLSVESGLLCRAGPLYDM